MKLFTFLLKIILLILIFFTACSNSESPDNYYEYDWKLAKSPYLITDTVSIDSGEVFRVQPGVVIRFASNAVFIVNGTLIAKGTNSDSIRFTSGTQNKEKFWKGIIFENCSNNSILEYCIVEYGMDKFIKIINSSPTISSCCIRYLIPHAETGGCLIYCSGNSFPKIQNNIIAEFYNYMISGIMCIAPSNPLLCNNDIYCNNYNYGIAINGGGFLDGNYLAAEVIENNHRNIVVDNSLGEPVDIFGDGIFSTNSTNSIKLFSKVDGVKNPRHTPNFP